MPASCQQSKKIQEKSSYRLSESMQYGSFKDQFCKANLSATKALPQGRKIGNPVATFIETVDWYDDNYDYEFDGRHGAIF